MESKVIFTLTWHGSVLEEHISQLEQAAQERAFEMVGEGYGEGELCANLTSDTGEVEYRGWWSVKFEQN